MLKHYEYACIGTDSCLKQRAIPKHFLKVLKQIRDLQNGSKTENQVNHRDSSTEKSIPVIRRTRLAADELYQNEKDSKTCSEFMSLVDQITAKRNSVRRDWHLRQNFVPLSG